MPTAWAEAVLVHVGSPAAIGAAWDIALKAAAMVFRVLWVRSIQLRMVNLGGVSGEIPGTGAGGEDL